MATCCKHAVGVCNNEEEAGRSVDWAIGGVGGGDIRRVHAAGISKHTNTLWAVATMGRKPGVRLMGLPERWARSTSGEFKPQDVANKIWACGKGRTSGERLMGLLDRRAKATSGSSGRSLS